MNEPVANRDRSWAASPCSSCRTSPCCTRLPLHRFHIENHSDFAWAGSILAHPRIELGLYDSGWWMAYYLAPCRFLNPLDSKCLIHGTTRQPQICRDYSPVRCWYKRVFSPAAPEPEGLRAAAGLTPAAPEPEGLREAGKLAALDEARDFIRFDAGRFEALAGMVAFDEAGELSSVPPWELLHSQITALPLIETTAAGRPIEKLAPPPPDPVPSPDDSAPAAAETSFQGSLQALRGGLAFPIRTPRTRRDLDLVRFRLGFHGVRVGVNGDEWVTLIGNPPEAQRFHVLSYETLDALLASFTFDEGGAILRGPLLAPARHAPVPADPPRFVPEASTPGPEPGASM